LGRRAYRHARLPEDPSTPCTWESGSWLRYLWQKSEWCTETHQWMQSFVGHLRPSTTGSRRALPTIKRAVGCPKRSDGQSVTDEHTKELLTRTYVTPRAGQPARRPPTCHNCGLTSITLTKRTHCTLNRDGMSPARKSHNFAPSARCAERRGIPRVTVTLKQKPDNA
jgi:hypothetical protein